MQITASTNADDLTRRLNNAFARQVPFATANALNAVAWRIRDNERGEMARAFDRPTPFTMNAFEIVPARKDKQIAEVRTKAVLSGKHYLHTQVTGGPRPQTTLEKRFMFGLATDFPIWGIIPATGGGFNGAILDQYGNWSPGQRQRVLSALRIQGDPTNNARPGKRSGYFVATKGLAPGVYYRRTPGGIPIRILKFLAWAPVYTPRFDFEGVAQRTFAQAWRPAFEGAMQRALDTAR